MLDRLPREIILQINDYLSFYPKFNLALCCRRLYSKLYNNRLFENLQILSKNKEIVVKLLEEKNIDTSRIKTVQITSPTQEDSKSTGVFSSLTNVQEISVDSPYLYNVAQFGPLEGFSYLKDTIQKHDNLHGLPIITQLLKMYTFPYLTSLCLGGSQTDQTNNPLVCLANVPNLVSLELQNCRVSIKFLEELHQRCRHLQSLKLGGGTFCLLSEQLPEPIVPADELTTFSSTLFIINDRSCKFIRYIIDKYPSLTTFDINDWLDMPRLYARRGIVTYIVSNTHRAYRQHLPGLMMELLPRLQTLKIEPYFFNDFFETLENIPHQLTSLCVYNSGNRYDMFLRMKKSHAFLNSMNYLTSLKVEVKYAQHLYHKKYQHPNITHLHLYQNHAWIHIPTFVLDMVLHTYNGLQALDFQCPTINMSIDKIDDNAQHANLQKLSISASVTTHEIFDYIDHCLLNVKELYWECSHPNQSSYTISLPNHTLDMLNFHCYPPHVRGDLTVTPIFNYHIKKEDLTKKVEVFKVGEENYKIKESVEAKEKNVADVKEEDLVQVKEEVEAPTLEAENRLNSTCINIVCKNIRELRCGNRIIF